jgi:hypothetical protein
MAKEKSSLKEIVINVLILGAAGGLLFWRVRDCKQKEREAAESVAEAKAASEKRHERRKTACLESVRAEDRNACIECTCTSCLDEFEACQGDNKCTSLSIAALLRDGGPPPDDPGRLLFEARANCMLQKCGDSCTGGKPSPVVD